MGNQIQFIQNTIITHSSHAALTSTVPSENQNATNLAIYTYQTYSLFTHASFILLLIIKLMKM